VTNSTHIDADRAAFGNETVRPIASQDSSPQVTAGASWKILWRGTDNRTTCTPHPPNTKIKPPQTAKMITTGTQDQKP
jgi:hypothetical protein